MSDIESVTGLRDLSHSVPDLDVWAKLFKTLTQVSQEQTENQFDWFGFNVHLHEPNTVGFTAYRFGNASFKSIGQLYRVEITRSDTERMVIAIIPTMDGKPKLGVRASDENFIQVLRLMAKASFDE